MSKLPNLSQRLRVARDNFVPAHDVDAPLIKLSVLYNTHHIIAHVIALMELLKKLRKFDLKDAHIFLIRLLQ